jgi:beta-mannosidase
LTEIGNDKTSGESHAGSFEAALEGGIENYRALVSNTDVPFISECAIMGPSSKETIAKIFPEDKLWPMNEYWDDRLMDNPYASILMTFAKREDYYATTMYGASANVEQFIAKGMTIHAETLRAEIEYARANKVRCGGFMNWMFSEIWPSATWAVVDYYGEPKQAFYQMKNSFAPILLTFVQKKGGMTALTVVNDTGKAFKTKVTYGVKTLKGNSVWKKTASLSIPAYGVAQVEVTDEIAKENTYLYAECSVGKETLSTVYSYDMWHTCAFESKYTYKVKKTEKGLMITLKAKEFAKGVTLRLPDNYKYTYSDNYFDMQAGEKKVVYVYGDAKVEDLVVTDFAKEITHA